MARAGIEETWWGKFRAHQSFVGFSWTHFLLYFNLHRSGLEPAITAATARQRCVSRARQIPPGIIAEFVRQLAVAPCARQGYCMTSKTKAEAIAIAVDDFWMLYMFLTPQLAAASWASQRHPVLPWRTGCFWCFECQLPEFPQRLSGQPLCRPRSFPSKQAFCSMIKSIFSSTYQLFDALVTLVVDLKLCIF